MARSSLVTHVFLALLTAAGLTAAIHATPTRAQNDASPQIDTLMQFTLEDDDVPSGTVAVRLLRIRLEPGARSPLHTHPGPEMNLVTDGTFRAAADGDALWHPRRQDGTPEAATTEPPEGEFIMRRGDAIAFLPGTAMTFQNTGSSDAFMLGAVIQPFGPAAPPGRVWIGQAPTEEDQAGVFSQVLGDGLADSLPAGQVVLRLERMALEPGQPIPAFSGPVMLSLAEGALEFTVQGGSVQVSRTNDPGPRPDAEAGTAFTLEAGDGVFFPAGMADAARAADESALELYRLTIAPAAPSADGTPVAAEQGVIEITTPPQPTPAPEPTVTPTPAGTPEPAAGEIEEGATVVVTADGVRIRGGPSTDSDIVTEVNTGYVLEITGPSEEGDDFTWWPVEDPDDPAISGYIAADFIELPEDDESEE